MLRAVSALKRCGKKLIIDMPIGYGDVRTMTQSVSRGPFGKDTGKTGEGKEKEPSAINEELYFANKHKQLLEELKKQMKKENETPSPKENK